VPPLSEEALEKEIQRFKKGATTIENPTVIFERSYKFAFVRHAMIKIAYELAFLWLGEDYLDDPSAAELRSAICSDDPSSTDTLAAYVADAEGFEAFKLWPASETEHLAFAFASDDGIAIAVRVFNIHAAFVWVTKETARFLSNQNIGYKLRFIRMDSISGDMQDTPVAHELERIATKIAAEANTEMTKPARP
jgi:hypothetical protein